ncbi:hypothetical protein OAG82_02635 [Rubripirellula sp.]|nr:hypothetical protein [Rubripirellula sp.]MDB4621734.1 hypothetical protein [Rubripirellula sp.]
MVLTNIERQRNLLSTASEDQRGTKPRYGSPATFYFACTRVFTSGTCTEESIQSLGQQFWRLAIDTQRSSPRLGKPLQHPVLLGQWSICLLHPLSQWENDTATVRIFDLRKDTELIVGRGFNPRWTKQHNWLIYSTYNSSKGLAGKRVTENMLHDADTGATKVLVPDAGAVVLGETDANDRWIYGSLRDPRAVPKDRIVRISLPAGKLKFLPDVSGIHLLPNPRHPLFFSREASNTDPFAATRAFYDLDGNNRRIGVPTLQKCHMSWLGDGNIFYWEMGLSVVVSGMNPSHRAFTFLLGSEWGM